VTKQSHIALPVEGVFKAIDDPSRRALLDRLFRDNGLTLSDLCDGLGMTRFGVMKHLRVLEAAGLITTRKVGREKRHYLNPVPIRLIHDRWVSKYTAPFAAALVELKTALESPGMPTDAVQIFQIVIRATPERVWQALTDPSFTRRFPFYMPVDSTFRLGDPIRWADDSGRLAVEGAIIESDPPRRLVHTWVVRYDTALSHETSRIAWVIEPLSDSVCRLTVTHDLTNAPLTAAHISGGWTLILSGIKTLLETGEMLVIREP
jgi:uncharacterized protein YndB with AHSA1/START domain/DNA-binding transcriptional ArsR family regulator